MQPFTLHSFPRAILHIDGDAFFASCEVAKNPALKGKPVITGKERGIASSMSYEAKARGVTRAMRLSDILKICPDAVILPSDYETYSLYSKRMYEIVRRYTADIEEYSIDECFADLTGMRRPNKMSYEEMAAHIKHDLDTELGMTFSVGLSVNKVLAKVGSKWKKPSGLTVIPGYSAHLYLSKLPVGKIWGIGPNTSAYMNKFGIVTAFDFANKDADWVKRNFSKPFQEIHRELRGEFVYPLTLGEKHDYASISKTRTFTPPSKDKEFVFSQLSKNIENACIKLRRHNLFTTSFAFFLKTQDFKYHGLEINLTNPVSIPQEILSAIKGKFGLVYRENTLYRATGVVLMKLTHENTQTGDLFGHSAVIKDIQKIYQAVDTISAKYGKHAVYLGTSFAAMHAPAHKGDRGDKSERRVNLLKGETERMRIGIPYLGEVL
jgi:DNA polymerase-4/DNA polymerase V